MFLSQPLTHPYPTTMLVAPPLGLSVTATLCARKCLVSMLVHHYCTHWKVSMCYTAGVKYIWYMYKGCQQEDRYSDAVTQGHTPPPSSNGSCKPIDENPTVLQGHAAVEIRLVSPLPAGPPVLLPPAGSPTEWGPHI